MKQPEPQDASSWFKRGKKQYWKDKDYEAAIASFNRVLDLVPKKYTVWNYRGLALHQLKDYHEAIASFNKSLEVKEDYHKTWNYRGLSLNALERYPEAINSYTKALTFKPTYYQARNNLGNTLKNSRCYKEAIASYDRALELKKNQYWQAWRNRGWAFFYSPSSSYQEALKNWNDGLQQLKPKTCDYQEGCGELHNAKGRAQYLHGQQQEDPFPDWKDAASSYQAALNFLTFEKFPLRHLEVRQALIVVWWGMGQIEDAQESWLEGNALLKRLLQDTPSPGKKLLLARTFAGFTQLGVDWYAQSGNSVAALELAEERKNTCLRWLRYGWGDEPRASPKFPELQKLLNSQTAAIYWHVSPAAITTFILRYNQPPQVYSAPTTADDVTYPAAARQLRDFENWVKDWKQNYQDYRAGKEKGTEEKLSHFTGHGEHEINQPLESALLLAGEDKLTLRDVFELDLSRYHLIGLSACETALTSKQGLIDEFVGLVSGFLAKGATYVVSTLWAVDEYSTALLMVRFYQYLQEEKMPPPSALKAAQKWLRTVTHPQLIKWYQSLAAQFEDKNSDIQFYLNQQVKRLQKDSAKIDSDQSLYAHPYYWAGFTVTGKV